MDLDVEARIAELRSMRFALQKTKFRVECMLDEISKEIEILIRKIEVLIKNNDSNDHERDKRI